MKDIFSNKIYDEINLNKNIFLLTDGEVEDKEKTLELIESNNHKFRIFSIGIGEYFDEDLIKRSGLLGKGGYNYCKEISELNSVVAKEINNVNNPWVSKFELNCDLDNENIIKKTQVPDLIRINDIINFHYIIPRKNIDKINFDIIFCLDGKNGKEQEIKKNYKIIPMEFSKGEELSKLLIKNDLKNYSIKENLDKAIKYQILDENTALFAEIELSNQIKEEMKIKILGDEVKNVLEIYRPNINNSINRNRNHIFQNNFNNNNFNMMNNMNNKNIMNNMNMNNMNNMNIMNNMNMNNMNNMNIMNNMNMNNKLMFNPPNRMDTINPVSGMNSMGMGMNPMMKINSMGMGMNPMMQMNSMLMGMNPIGMGTNNIMGMMNNRFHNPMMDVPSQMNQSQREEYKRMQRIQGYMTGKKMTENRKKSQEENTQATSSSKISNEEEEKKEKLEKINKKIEEEKKRERKYEEESLIKKEELERKKSEEKEKLMKIIKTQDYIDGFWDVNEKTKFIFEKYKKEYDLLKEQNINDKVAMTILMIYYLKNEHFEL